MMNKIKLFFRQESFALIEQIIFSLGSFFIITFSSKELGVNIFGQYSLLLLTSVFNWMIIMQLIIVPYISHKGNKEYALQDLVLASIILSILSSFILAILLSYFVSAIDPLVIYVYLILYSILEALKKINNISNSSEYNIMFNVIFIAALYYIHNTTLLGFINSAILTYFLIILIALPICLCKIGRSKLNWKWFGLISDSNNLKNMLSSIFVSLGSNANAYISSLYISHTFVGALRLGQSFSSVIAPISQVVEVYLPPKINDKKYLYIIMSSLYFILIIFGFMMWLFWDDLVLKIINLSYSEYKNKILLVYFVSLSFPIIQYLRIKLRSTLQYDILIKSSVISAVLSLPITFILINQFSVEGAIASLYINQILSIALLIMTRLFQFIPIKQIKCVK